MGKGRSEIKRIENTSQRQSTFYKRRDGLFKKAKELAILCDTDLLLLLFSSSGKLHEYHSPSVPSAKELIQRYEAAVKTKVLNDDCWEQSAEVEKIERLCEILERQLRFMKVEEGQHYSLPVLNVLEHNLELAINKVRSEKDKKIHMEIGRLEKMVRDGEQERYILHEQLANIEAMREEQLRARKSEQLHYGSSFNYELDLKLGLN